MVKYWIFLSCWSAVVVASHAQTGGVEGTVFDAETNQPLPFAHVFINNTTHVTTTNVEGNYILHNLPVGQLELVSTFVGYETSQSKVTIKPGEVSNLSIQLKPSLQQLSEITVKESKDKTWEKHLNRFQKLFLGTVARSECVIKNPWVIDFSFQDGNRIFIAKASEPIEIENYSLGYTLFFYLKNFQTDGDSYMINGNAYFKEMEDRNKAEAWQKARDAVYLGSERHLFRSLINQTAASEGFKLYIDKAGALNINNRSDIFYPEVGVKVLEYKLEPGSISLTAMPNEYVIQVQGRTEVHYLKKPGTTRLYKDMPGQVSWLEVRGNRVRVNGQGVILNPGDVVFSGEISSLRIGSLLPFDFEPTHLPSKEAGEGPMKLPVERVYIQTDKPYYYPGETIWLKAYLQYQHCDVPDSLSKVLYLDLINDARKIVKSKILLIDDRTALAEFRLPPDFIPGDYMLRAYTNWMRNFGDALFYTKPVPVLKIQEKPQPLLTLGATTTDNLVLVLDKEAFKHRERIDFSVFATNAAGDTVGANLSVAVTDSKQVVSIPDADNIVSAMEVGAVANPANVFFKVERGVGIKGTFLNKKQEPESASLTAIVGDFDQVFSVRTEATGRFEIKDIYLYDSALFRFQAKSKKGLPYGTIQFEPNSVPPVTTWKRFQKISIVDVGNPQRVITDYQAEPGTLVLKETTVTASRIEDPVEEVHHKIFGKPDYVVTSADLMTAGTADLTVALRGKVPSLTVTTYTDNQGVHNVIRLKAASSFQLGNEPLVLIDGNPIGAVGGSGAGDRLRTLDINMVDRVEITIRANSMYGDAGRNGVIAVFTKLNSAGNNLKSVDTKTMHPYTLIGFTAPLEFRTPDYASQNLTAAADYRSTIFWQPLVKTSREKPVAQLSFYAADLTTRYRIVVEGILDTGEPVRSEVSVFVSDQ